MQLIRLGLQRFAGRRSLPLLRAAALLLPLLAVVGCLLVAVIGNTGNPFGAGVAVVVPAAAVTVARTRSKCAGCGVVGATRLLEAPANASSEGDDRGYEVSVRMLDGSQRQFTGARPATWRPGERVIVIDDGILAGE